MYICFNTLKLDLFNFINNLTIINKILIVLIKLCYHEISKCKIVKAQLIYLVIFIRDQTMEIF